ncbi:MAG TPA: 4Fe-4S binding protein, partial [Phycisphaerae bacterium]
MKEHKRCTSRTPRVGGDVALPVLDASSVSGGKVRKSRNGPRRAAVLIAVHVLFIGHLVHWKLAGRTLSPVEPSETMYALNHSHDSPAVRHLNAGFFFFAIAILATLIFGRFFCGWGCHIVAYQDFCAWLMKKMGIKPKPFRSRLLVWVPLLAALYMFVWPNAYRVLFAHTPAPPLVSQITTTEFWKTFPGPIVAIATVLICGFAAVYFLGAKGFCTYACPYGGFFGLADKVAPVRIRVTDACEHCGHCTAVCTSNVRVHEEVARYGMVVDPGCMKCMDCVSVCPNDALYVGFGAPAIATGRIAEKRAAARKDSRTSDAPPRKPAPRRYDLSWPGEIALSLVFLTVLLCFRSLYGWFPFLMSLGMAAVVSYILLQCYRLFAMPTVTIQNWRPKVAGAIQPSGWGLLALGAVLVIWTAHSGFVQYNRFAGEYAYAAAGMPTVGIDLRPPATDARELTQLNLAAARLERVARWALVRDRRLAEMLAGLNVRRGDSAQAQRSLEQMIARDRDFSAEAYLTLGTLRVRAADRATREAARGAFMTALSKGGPATAGREHLDRVHAQAHVQLAQLAGGQSDTTAALQHLQAALL